MNRNQKSLSIYVRKAAKKEKFFKKYLIQKISQKPNPFSHFINALRDSGEGRRGWASIIIFMKSHFKKQTLFFCFLSLKSQKEVSILSKITENDVT